MSDELERMWKEAIMVYFKVSSRRSLGSLRKITKNLRRGDAPAEILTRSLRIVTQTY
jgi:hypothetical protein